MSGRHKKIVRVNSRRPINIDQVFFGAVAVYLCIVCYMGLTTTHVSGYEVNTGTRQSIIPIPVLPSGRKRSTRQRFPDMSAIMPVRETVYQDRR